jgi:hypothetical protein
MRVKTDLDLGQDRTESISVVEEMSAFEMFGRSIVNQCRTSSVGGTRFIDGEREVILITQAVVADVPKDMM